MYRENSYSSELPYPICGLHHTLDVSKKHHPRSIFAPFIIWEVTIEEKAETAPTVRKKAIPLISAVLSKSGGDHTGSLYHQRVSHHFHLTKNGLYLRPAYKTDLGNRYPRFLPFQPNQRGGRIFSPGIWLWQHRPYSEQDAFLCYDGGTLLHGRFLEVQSCAH